METAITPNVYYSYQLIYLSVFVLTIIIINVHPSNVNLHLAILQRHLAWSMEFGSYRSLYIVGQYIVDYNKESIFCTFNIRLAISESIYNIYPYELSLRYTACNNTSLHALMLRVSYHFIRRNNIVRSYTRESQVLHKAALEIEKHIYSCQDIDEPVDLI